MNKFSYVKVPLSVADFNFNKKPLWTKEAAQAALDSSDSDYRWGYAAPAPGDPYWRTYLDRHWGKKEVFDPSIEGPIPYRRERLPKGNEMYVIPDLPPKQLDTVLPKRQGLSASSLNPSPQELMDLKDTNYRNEVWKAEKLRDKQLLDIGAGKDYIPEPAISESKEELWEKVKSISDKTPDTLKPPSSVPAPTQTPVTKTIPKTFTTVPVSAPTPSAKPSLLNRRNLLIGGGLLGLAGLGTATALYLKNKYDNEKQ